MESRQLIGHVIGPWTLRKATVERACHVFAVSVCLLLLAAANVAAQAETSASIIGRVTDSSGAVLPGVTITAASPALIVRQMTTVSDERGEYRITSLPIGTYDVDVSLEGFRAVRREGLRLTANFSARYDVVLELGALAETITVSGASPVVDVTSTTTTTALTRESLELIPSSRNGLDAIMAQAPGIRSTLDVGGSSAGVPPTFRVFGRNAEPWPLMEGVLFSSPKSGAQSGVYQDYATVEEVQVSTMGAGAEAAAVGVQLTAILKSGGNAFHGGSWYSYTNGDMASNNIDAALASQGITAGNPIVVRWDLSGDIGGYIVPDQLWFYGGSRARRNLNGVLDCAKEDGSQCDAGIDQLFYTGKLTYLLNPSNKLVGFYQWMTKTSDDGVSQFADWSSRSRRIQPTYVSKFGWESTLGGSTFAEAQIGYFEWGGRSFGGGNCCGFAPGKVATRDLRTLRITGQSVTLGQPGYPGESRLHGHGSLTWYRPNWFHGNHEFRLGFDVLPQQSRWWFGDRGDSGNYQLIFNDGVPFQIETWNSPVSPIERNLYTGIYFKDGWSINRRLTLNLGVRFARDRVYVPEQSREDGTFAPAATFERIDLRPWTTVVPRLHFAYDATGDGKTVIKGGWGRFVHMRGIDEASPSNPNARQLTRYTWRDLNGNKMYEAGEVNLDVNGPDFVTRAYGNSSGSVPGNAVQDPNEKPPMTDEVFTSFEREIMANFAVRVSGIYSREFNVQRLLNTRRPYEAYNIPITNPDPGPDGRVGTVDDPGTTITYYDYSASLRGLAFQVPMLTNDPAAVNTWKTVEISATKRLSNRWQTMATWTATKINVPFTPNIGGGNDLLVSTFDPNSEIFSAQDVWEWGVKVSGVYQLPWDFLTSANYDFRSGQPWARTVLSTRTGAQIPSMVLRVEPIGTRNLPHLHLLDFRAEKTVRLGGHTVGLRLDLFNALNINTVTGVTAQSGATFARPTSIIPGRNVQIGLRYSF